MSRYSLDKFLAHVEGSDDEVHRYVRDPASYVRSWTERADSSRLPTPDSGPLTDEERSALATIDHGELYRLGAHPYLLWHFIEAVRVWAGDMTWPDMVERYRVDIGRHGVPWYGT